LDEGKINLNTPGEASVAVKGRTITPRSAAVNAARAITKGSLGGRAEAGKEKPTTRRSRAKAGQSKKEGLSLYVCVSVLSSLFFYDIMYE